jgi:uncharacterized protein
MKNQRIELIDALRGFAILAIILLHNMEHFEFVYAPPQFPDWLKTLDKNMMFAGYFLFGGKAYAIFALIFGFSFYIQNENQNQKGQDFRLRFFWRMLLLLVFGFINTAFYQGDILTMYAILGLILIPVCNLSNKTVFILATIFMLQPVEWFKYFYALLHPTFQFAPNLSNLYYSQIGPYMQNGGFIENVIGNLTLGKAASLLWSWENGRFFQAPALFMYGMLLGRKGYFLNTPENLLLWKKTLKIAAIAFVPLYLFTIYLPDFVSRTALINSLLIIFNSWANFALMLVWTAGFIILFYTLKPNNLLTKLVNFGKMSLTTYIMQSMIGAILYYKYGFGLYQHTGPTICLFIGIASFLAQVAFNNWWLKTHKQGPLEKLWHQLTWMKF